QRHRRPIVLQRRKINLRLRLFAKLEAANVRDHTDDLKPDWLPVLVSASERNALSDRIFVRKYLARRLLIDNHHVGGGVVIAIGVSAALDEGNAHRAKIIRTD